ncbi:MAG: response regulator, partial [Acidobacteriota bacterium]|nr:response regulator [Acidobacteriota bacterium]
LVIDDDRMVRDYMRMVLQRSDFEVMAPCSATEALSVIDQPDPGIDAVVSDIDMPDMDGFTFARAVIQRFPKMPILMVSGILPEEQDEGRFAFLRKPFGPADLTRAVGRLLGT